eukprot:365291-Chlamydomonas_euryale.AAC.13
MLRLLSEARPPISLACRSSATPLLSFPSATRLKHLHAPAAAALRLAADAPTGGRGGRDSVTPLGVHLAAQHSARRVFAEARPRPSQALHARSHGNESCSLCFGVNGNAVSEGSRLGRAARRTGAVPLPPGDEVWNAIL